MNDFDKVHSHVFDFNSWISTTPITKITFQHYFNNSTLCRARATVAYNLRKRKYLRHVCANAKSNIARVA
jgi:hypothetical protein